MTQSTDIAVDDGITDDGVAIDFDTWVSHASDRELLQFNARKLATIETLFMAIQQGIGPMIEKAAPFLASMGL